MQGREFFLSSRDANQLFPFPLACLCGRYKGVLVAGIYNSGVRFNIRQFQKRLSPFIGGNRLEMTESILDEIDRSVLNREFLDALVRENDGDCVEQLGWHTGKLPMSRHLFLLGELLQLAESFVRSLFQVCKEGGSTPPEMASSEK